MDENDGRARASERATPRAALRGVDENVGNSRECDGRQRVNAVGTSSGGTCAHAVASGEREVKEWKVSERRRARLSAFERV